MIAFADFGLGALAKIEGAPAAEVRAQIEPALERVREVPGPPQIIVVMQSALASLDIGEGHYDTAVERLAEAVNLGVRIQDMPVMAAALIATAELAAARNRPERAAELLGVAVGMRGVEEHGNEDVARITAAVRPLLGEAGFEVAHERGRTHSREDALDLLREVLGVPLGAWPSGTIADRIEALGADPRTRRPDSSGDNR
jgi:ATP/maltotriose-dependent transcriptional regulator MalT